MHQTHPIGDFNRRAVQRTKSPNSLLPTKVSEITLRDGRVAYEAFPPGQGSRWTALPVAQWIESLAGATEAIDHRGLISIGGLSLSDPSPMVHIPATTRMLPPVAACDGAACTWDFIAFVDFHDRLATMYTRQMKNLAGYLEASVGLTSSQVTTMSPSKAERWLQSYQTLQSRFEFTFHRIMEQNRRDSLANRKPFVDGASGSDPIVSTETGDVRLLLDTLYEETIEKLKKQICDQQFSMQRGQNVTAGYVKTTTGGYPAQQSVKPAAELSKHDLARHMTAWLRANFTNPYPDDEGLAEMAEMYGTTNQVISNWLINARTRKWRPALIKASELGRPADLLLEDSLNIFDGKDIRQVDLEDYVKTDPPREQQPLPSDQDMLMCDELFSLSHDNEAEFELAKPMKRVRMNYRY